MILENQEEIYKTLLKVNQVGKKLTTNSKYILNNGIVFGYSKQEMSDVEANPVSIGIIDEKLCKKINGFDRYGLLIDGNELYKMSQEYDFDHISLSPESININFVYYAVDDNKYIEDFQNLLKDKGFKDEDIKIAAGTNYTSNIDMYDLYLGYKKNVEPSNTKHFCVVKCYFTNINNFMYKKVSEIIYKIHDSKSIYEEDIKQEILDIITGSAQPVIRNLHSNIGDISIRLMKSMFNPISTKNSAALSIRIYNEDLYLITITNNPAVTIFNIFKIIKY